MKAANDNKPKQVNVGTRVLCPPFKSDSEWIPSDEMGEYIRHDIVGSSSLPDEDGCVAEFRSTAGNPIFAALVVDEVYGSGGASSWHIETYRTYEEAQAACSGASPSVDYDQDSDEDEDDELPSVIGSYARLVGER